MATYVAIRRVGGPYFIANAVGFYGAEHDPVTRTCLAYSEMKSSTDTSPVQQSITLRVVYRFLFSGSWNVVWLVP